ncbi:sugar transferase [Lachnospiraceae bacterium C1.1]|nr:sugar transferase [Lachnospiraceae bacterium C1.1]
MNRKNYGANTNVLQMFIDGFVLILAFVFSLIIFKVPYYNISFVKRIVALFAIFLFTYIAAAKEKRLYNVTLFFYFDRHIRLVTSAFAMALVVTSVILLFFLNPYEQIRRFYIIFLIASYLFMLINVIVSRLVQIVVVRYNAPRAAFVGVHEDFEKFNYFLNKTSMRLDEIGYINYPGRTSKGISNVLGDIEDIEQIIRDHEIDQIYFFKYNEDSEADISKYVDICLEMGITVRVIMESFNRSKVSSYVSAVGVYPMITYHTIALNEYEQCVKRLIDIVASFVGIIITSPIMLLTALAIKIDSPGPVFFVQKRVGQNGRVFKMYKFRSMCAEAESQKSVLAAENGMEDEIMFKMKDDPRVTRVGKFIRRTSIDELPQLFNVLIGNMSIVGTRPPTIDEVERYKRCQWRRLSIKPGITGLWQVSGRSDIRDFDDVVKLDVKYIDNWSIMYDIKILFKTVIVLFGKNNGAY